MLTEQMQSFINMAIVDGKLEPKELEFLRKKAVELGEDPDEVEFTVNTAIQEKKPKTTIAGTVKKCPSCGAPVESFQTRCPSCGHELSGISASEGVKEFFEHVDKLEASGDTRKRASALGIWVVFWLVFAAATVLLVAGAWEYPYVTLELCIPALALYAVSLVLSIVRRPVWTVTDGQEQSLIENYPLPNTKEDLTEFAILAASKIAKVSLIAALFFNKGKYQKEWNAIWTKKCKQVYKKAQLSMAASDPQGFASIKGILREAQVKLN
jgi:hypothetical protein